MGALHLYQPLLDLAVCLKRTVVEETGKDLCWSGLYPGNSAPYEYCGACNSTVCGVGFVSILSAEPYDAFGLGETIDMRCNTPIQVLVNVGVMRCFPMEEDGSTSAPEIVEQSAIDLIEDMHAIRKAVLCCFEGQARLQRYQTIGPEGGCVGGVWQTWIALE